MWGSDHQRDLDPPRPCWLEYVGDGDGEHRELLISQPEHFTELPDFSPWFAYQLWVVGNYKN